MNYKGHLIVGGLSSTVIGFLIKPNIWYIIFGTLSALAPDIDHPKSKATSLLRGVVLLPLSVVISMSLFDDLAKMVLVTLGIFLLLIMLTELLRPRHRGITHGFAAALAYAIMIFLISKDYYLAVFGLVGYVSHLIADGVFKIF